MSDLTWKEKMRQPRRRHSSIADVVDFGASYTGNGEVHGHELGPSLNKLHCRECGAEVTAATCKACKEKERAA